MGSDLSAVNEDRLANMATGGAWRRPRMKVYDYNQEFGGNYYQPMIQYINHKTQIKELNGTTAMTRVNLMKNIVASRRQPHSPLDNVNTPYNPIRLLKGAPPGQDKVNQYISELSITKDGNHKLDTKRRKHLAMIDACE